MSIIHWSPQTQKEHNIVRIYGTSSWKVIDRRENVWCLGNVAGVLISNKNHIRWIKATQEIK
jgi:hypothetical protein